MKVYCSLVRRLYSLEILSWLRVTSTQSEFQFKDWKSHLSVHSTTLSREWVGRRTESFGYEVVGYSFSFSSHRRLGGRGGRGLRCTRSPKFHNTIMVHDHIDPLKDVTEVKILRRRNNVYV